MYSMPLIIKMFLTIQMILDYSQHWLKRWDWIQDLFKLSATEVKNETY